MDNAASALVDAPVDAGWGGETALVSPGGAVTRRELLGLTDRAARGLRRLGVESGDRVALLLPDGPAFPAAFLGAIKLGAVAVPLNTRLAGEHARLLDDAEARVAFAALAPRCRIVGWEALVEGASAERLPAAAAGADAMAFWLSVVAELPRTTTGKLQRFRLRELAQAGPEAAPDLRSPGAAAAGPGAGG